MKTNNTYCKCGKVIANFYVWVQNPCCSFYNLKGSIYVNPYGKFNSIIYYSIGNYIKFWDKNGYCVKEVTDCNFESIEELVSFVNKCLENLEFL